MTKDKPAAAPAKSESPQSSQLLRKAYIDMEPPLKKQIPTGPFRLAAKEQEGDLLLFVPRNEIGRMISNLTGRYGYSHLAVDPGEIDEPTGRRVMIEATVVHGVHYAFQDEYGERPFGRVPLWKTGLDVQGFCQCVRARVGEKFDDLEAITLGILDNPARQICSDLATVCLPEEMRQEIARCHHKAVIHPLAAVRDEKAGPGFRLFMSPNGFAEFLGIPKGKEIDGPDQLVEPHLQESSDARLFETLWKQGDTFLIGVWKFLRHV
jgi:hypothetical protein